MNRTLSKLLQQPIGEDYRSYQITVTPAIAAAVLVGQDQKQSDIGLCQRKLFGPRVQKYAQEMLDGIWEYGISSLHIASNGAVINGLHRLHACLQSGVSFTTDIFVNAKASIMPYIDPKSQGRTLGELLTILGYSDTTRLSQILPKAYAFQQGALISLRANKIPESEVVNLMAAEADELTAAAAFAGENPDGTRKPLIGFMYYAYARAGLLTPELKKALVSLRDGAELKANSMLLKFYTRVRAHGQVLKERRLYGEYFAVLNAVLAGIELNVRGFGNAKFPTLRPVDPSEKTPKAKKKAKGAGA